MGCCLCCIVDFSAADADDDLTSCRLAGRFDPFDLRLAAFTVKSFVNNLRIPLAESDCRFDSFSAGRAGKNKEFFTKVARMGAQVFQFPFALHISARTSNDFGHKFTSFDITYNTIMYPLLLMSIFYHKKMPSNTKSCEEDMFFICTSLFLQPAS